MKKQVTLIAQSKGGTGKSFITWFVAKNKQQDQAVFIDLDKSTRTSARLKSIVGEKRILELSIIDDHQKLDRELFLNLFERISQAKTSEWYVDLGAPESDELKSFFQNEVPAEELKDILEEIGVALTIWVIIAGEDAFTASVQYYQDLRKLTGEHFPLIAIKNEGTFQSLHSQESGDKMLEELGITAKRVGKMPVGNSSRELINLIAGQSTDADLTLAGRRSLRKVMEELKEALL